jgi:hypothetical protein
VLPFAEFLQKALVILTAEIKALCMLNFALTRPIDLLRLALCGIGRSLALFPVINHSFLNQDKQCCELCLFAV